MTLRAPPLPAKVSTGLPCRQIAYPGCRNESNRALTRKAISLILLVFIRSSELRFVRWSEIYSRQAIWEYEVMEGAISLVRTLLSKLTSN